MSEQAIEHSRISRAHNLYNEGKFEEALAELEGAPNSPEMLAEKARALEAVWEIDEAIECYKQIVQLNPGDTTISVKIADLLTSIGRYKDAVTEYQQVIDSGACQVEIYRKRAFALRLDNDLESALDGYNAALEIAPDDADTLTAKADLLIERGDFSAALDSLTRASNLGGLNASGWTSRGLNMANAGAVHEALQCYEQALKLNSKSTQALLGRAAVHEHNDDFEAALDDYNRATEIRPEDGEIWASKGLFFYTLRKFEDALECFKKAVDRNENDKFSWANLGSCRLEIEEPQAALEDYSRAIALDSDYAHAWLGRATCLDILQRPAEALKDYRRALELDPELPWANNNIGFLLAKSFGQNEKALEYFDKSLELIPNETIPLVNKAEVLVDLGRYQEAQALLEHSIERVSQHDRGQIVTQLGILFSEYLRDEKRALAYFEDAIKDGEDDIDNRLTIAELLIRLDQYDEARKQIIAASEGSSEAKIRVVASFLLFACEALAGEVDKSRARFAEFLKCVSETALSSDARPLAGSWIYKGFLESIADKELDLTTRFLLPVAIDLQTGQLGAPSLARLNRSLPLVELPREKSYLPLPEEEESGSLRSFLSEVWKSLSKKR